ncbi:hypothetical protein GQ44DRAFT_609472 [Phaeosphaeriaceae sp. PMI808]|nr:hypothetical protein GQ44DRAFT_609472 [Phaeosphaeriaceae sp. PMI808]
MANTARQTALMHVKPLTKIPKCPHTPDRPSPDDYGFIITVAVGSAEKHTLFYIHHVLLSHYSSYFRNALKPEWKGGEINSINLDEDCPVIFRVFFHWLYSGNLYTKLAPSGEVPVTYKILIDVYVFGDARGIPELCNAVIDLLFQKFTNEWVFPVPKIIKVYENTSANAKLRIFFAALAAEVFNFKDIKEKMNKYPIEFLADAILHAQEKKVVLGASVNRALFSERKASQLCSYHDHSNPHVPAILSTHEKQSRQT